MGGHHGYELVKADDRILAEFPGLGKKKLDQVNDLFKPYLFYEDSKEGRRVWTSCCHHAGELWERQPRTETQKHRAVMATKHNEVELCPYCHKPVTFKNTKKIGAAKNLREFIPVLFLHTRQRGKTVYAQGYWARKEYSTEECWAGMPLYMVTCVYRFRRGEWIAWQDEWVGRKGFKLVRKSGQWIGEPFTSGGLFFQYCGYKIVGLEELSKSFLRYTGIREKFEGKALCEGFIRHMGLYSLYPDGVEMLQKNGMTGPIDDWVWKRKKNAKVIKWDEQDPRKVFGLDGGELKEFLSESRNFGELAAYKAIRKHDRRVTFKQIHDLCDELGLPGLQDLTAALKRLPGLRISGLMDYLHRFAGSMCHGLGVRSVGDVARMWMDYIGFATELGYDLENPIIQTPRNLDLKHQEAYGAVAALNDEALGLDGKNRNQATLLRIPKLDARYGFESEHYLIRPPASAREIVAEGEALRHCVGGIAGIHARGSTTILFLRDKQRPQTPLVTIEMRGNRLVQVHGYRNECAPCPENPGCISPRKLYEEILTPWLAWVKAGSKRTKDGRPKLPNKKKEVNVA